MGGMGSEGELGTGYMLVPWSSWDQWNFVRESLFSSSHDSVTAALRRITAWKSRGCLPVAIEVTARIIEIQNMDPFFRKETASNTVNSEDMLAMLYCIALTRLVNGFVGKVSCFDDHAQKHGKKKHSISDLADAIGMPRMVIDIRHESSHRDLPSLPLVRLASTKALDWLKSHYWEPQRRAIPDVRQEIRSRLHQMIYHMKTTQLGRLNHSHIKDRRVRQPTALRMCQRLSSQISGKLLYSKSSLKQISKISKIIAKLYSKYPYKVASVLLEIFQSRALDLPNKFAFDGNYNSASSNQESHDSCMNELKDMIQTLSRKRPGLLLTILKEVLGTIEMKESTKYEKGEYSLLFPENQAEIHQTEVLSSLVPWLLSNLKELRDSGQIALFDETQVLSASKRFTPKVSLQELLRKCLLLSSSGNKHLLDSAIFVAEMIGNNSLLDRLKKLPLLSSQNIDITAENNISSLQTIIFQEEESIKQAIMKFDLLSSRLKTVCPEATHANTGMERKMWTVAKSWTPCPIGTLPCTFSSTAFVPVLDLAVGGCMNNDSIVNEYEDQKQSAVGKREPSRDIELLESSPPLKKLKETSENGKLDDGNRHIVPLMGGLLLVDGIWRKVGEEDLLDIASNVRILV
uniref:Ribosomal biogenesis protein LAS1L n=2 Tax=Anthurium amnicola TaxID=1678845 RepID=A0A1D1ZK34_9ARAE